MIQIIKYQNKYRDDMFFCLLSAKDALGRVPHLNEDLLDVEKNYFEKEEMFWLALDENDRVVGMVGTKKENDKELWLKRLYVKPSYKRKGIGTLLLNTLEKYVLSINIKKLKTRFSLDYYEANCFYKNKGFKEDFVLDSVRYCSKII